MKKREDSTTSRQNDDALVSACVEANRQVPEVDLEKVTGGLTPEKVEASSENIRRVK
jgi:hypothetical protein